MNRIRIGITDDDWFRFLEGLPQVDEVNFWMPSSQRAFRALAIGEPLLFKLHSPNDFIVGGGFFSHFTVLPVSLAWEAFGPKNGAPDFAAMRHRIARYRELPETTNEDFVIGCILLSSPFFFQKEQWIPLPPTWSRYIQQGKNYELAGHEGQVLWDEVRTRLSASGLQDLEEVAEDSPMYGDPVLVRQRLGQGTFRVLITDHYERCCAATGEKALPVLEAAHILPVANGGQHRPDNGLLLRSDLHRLFDRGYMTVDPDHRIHISQRLRRDFGNGEIYYPLENQQIRLPKNAAFRPRREFLQWHSSQFK